ncbi:hypothetical protein B0H17DRAFT_1124625 [Mycena rosella]|uniref:ribonuclease Z n=1 Tax=Mycena rosella TaxID=1033263 RepID=A0AAD7MB29_MYCRO|nr:hypothetical protein B0H17DRAFT_1124625 [Mycena rosella]
MTIERSGGLGGMLRFIDNLFDDLDIIGPPGTARYLSSTRVHSRTSSLLLLRTRDYFWDRDPIRVNVPETSFVPDLAPQPTPIFQDTHLSVYGIPIFPDECPAASPSEARKRPLSYKRPSGVSDESPPGLRPTMAYAAMGSPILGRFDVEKPDALGVSVTEHKSLQSGNDVVISINEGNTTVTRVMRPEDCMAPPANPTVAVTLDAPAPAYLPSLLESFTRSPFYSKIWSKSHECTVQSVFHLCGRGALEDKRYIKFMNGFHTDTYSHLMVLAGSQFPRMTFTNAALHQLRMNQLDPEVFPIPKISLAAKKDLAKISGLPANSFVMEPSLHVGIRPHILPVVGLPEENVDFFHPATSSTNLLDLSSSVLQQIEDLKHQVKTEETGSASPTLIRIPSRGSILLDASEGTLGQLARQLGTPDVCDVLRDLKCIFVSNTHWAHSGGLAAILAMRQQLDPPAMEPLYLVAVPEIHRHLREVHKIENILAKGSSLSDATRWMSLPFQTTTAKAGLDTWGTGNALNPLQLRLQGIVASAASISTLSHVTGRGLGYATNTNKLRIIRRAEKEPGGLDRGGVGLLREHPAPQRIHITVSQAWRSAGAAYGWPPSANFVMRQGGKDKPVVCFAFDANLTIGTMWKMNLYLPNPVINQMYQESTEVHEVEGLP